MKPTQVTEIVSIVKKYLWIKHHNGVITLRIKDSDFNALKTEIEGVLNE